MLSWIIFIVFQIQADQKIFSNTDTTRWASRLKDFTKLLRNMYSTHLWMIYSGFISLKDYSTCKHLSMGWYKQQQWK